MFTSRNIFIHFLGYVFYHVLFNAMDTCPVFMGTYTTTGVYSEVVQRGQLRSLFSSWSLLGTWAILRQRKYEIYDMRTNEV